MKLLIYTDVHFSSYSSIVRARTPRFSLRLENCIASVNWAEDLATREGCSGILCLGDFFDTPNLTAEELTAMKQIHWADLPHTFLCGNHELASKDAFLNSVNALPSNFKIISTPFAFQHGQKTILLLPYIFEAERESLSHYIRDVESSGKNLIVFSHNDIKGLQMGAFQSTAGFDVAEIEECCDLFVNGHLHNGEKFSRHGINLGNLTGQNFGEDATRYAHNAAILDIDTLELRYVENPYAFNFYKLDLSSSALPNFKVNAVVSATCKECQKDEVSSILKPDSELSLQQRICASRVNYLSEASSESPTDIMEQLKVEDHLHMFSAFVLQEFGDSEIVKSELEKILI